MKIIWYMVPKIKVWQTEILSLWAIFCPFTTPDNPEIQNLKLTKKTWRYYHFTHLHHKWQSSDVWFLKYGAQHNNLRRLKTAKLACTWNSNCRILDRLSYWEVDDIKMFEKWQSSLWHELHYHIKFLSCEASILDWLL